MIRRVFLKAAALGLLCSPAFAADPLPTLQETPMLADQVKSGALPPVDKRIPQQPRWSTKFAGGDGPGKPGGQLNMLVASARDTRLMTVYSYTRLIVYDDKFKLHPDILESYEDKEGREFTLKLRAGHKWSDGHPFTTEDFRFFWEDIANNKRALAFRPVRRASRRRPAAQGRDHRRAHHQVQLGQAQPLLHRKPGARRARSSCSGRRTTSRSSTASTPPEEIEIRPRAAQGQQLGATSTGART